MSAPRLYTVIGFAEFANATVHPRPLLEVEDGDVVVLSLFRHAEAYTTGFRARRPLLLGRSPSKHRLAPPSAASAGSADRNAT